MASISEAARPAAALVSAVATAVSSSTARSAVPAAEARGDGDDATLRIAARSDSGTPGSKACDPAASNVTAAQVAPMRMVVVERG